MNSKLLSDISTLDLSSSQTLTVLTLAILCEESGTAVVSLDELCEMTKLSKPTVSKCISFICEMGIFEKTRSGTKNKYLFLLSHSEPEAPAPTPEPIEEPKPEPELTEEELDALLSDDGDEEDQIEITFEEPELTLEEMALEELKKGASPRSVADKYKLDFVEVRNMKLGLVS